MKNLIMKNNCPESEDEIEQQFGKTVSYETREVFFCAVERVAFKGQSLYLYMPGFYELSRTIDKLSTAGRFFFTDYLFSRHLVSSFCHRSNKIDNCHSFSGSRRRERLETPKFDDQSCDCTV